MTLIDDLRTRPTADGDATTGLGVAVRGAWPLLASVLLLMVGAGLQGSLLGVRAEQARFGSGVIGLVLGVYYLGYVGGSWWTPGLVRRVGHVRVFAALASTASAAVVVHGVWVAPVPWMVLRFVTGVCVAGLFVVSESWLTDVSTRATRATLLAVYNTCVAGGLALGAGLLNAADTAGVVLFVVGSVVVSMAAVPVALAPSAAPPPRPYRQISWAIVWRAAPLGLIGVVVSGFTVGAALGFGPVFATRAGFGVAGASQFVVVLLLGAVAGQVPLGNWSDRTDRRFVVLTAGLLVLGGSGVAVAATRAGELGPVLVGGALVGAGGFSLYGLSMAHLADYVDAELMVSAGSRLVIANGLGAAAGPVVASLAIASMGPEGLFWMLAVLALPFCAFVLVRVRVRAAVEESDRSHFTPLASSATMTGLVDVVPEVVGEELDDMRRRLRRLRARVPRPGRRSGGAPPTR